MKITLISTHKGDIGIRSISSYAKANGLEDIDMIVAPLFEDELYNSEQIEAIKQKCKDSDLIGISSSAISDNRTIQLLNELRKDTSFESKFIVTGGITSTLTPEHYLEYRADGSNIYEGEVSFTELATRLRDKGDVYSTENFWFRKDGETIRNPVRRPIQNLDDLPFPDYDFRNSRHYTITAEGLEEILTQSQAFEDIPNLTAAGQGNLFEFTVRGCPRSCSYCSNDVFLDMNKSLDSPSIRKQSVKKVVSDLEKITDENRGIGYISFFDDDFFIRTHEEIEEFSELYKEKINLPFFVYANPNTFSEEKLKLLLDAGMDRLGIGFQTGSRRMLKLYNRPISDIGVAGEVTRIIAKYSPQMQIPDFDFLINSPFETEEDISQNIDFIRGLHRPFEAHMHNLHLFPGSRLYTKAIEENILPYNNLGHELQDHRHYIQEKLQDIKDSRNYYTLILYLMTGQHISDRLGAITEEDLSFLMSIYKNERLEFKPWIEKKLKELPIINYYANQERTYKR